MDVLDGTWQPDDEHIHVSDEFVEVSGGCGVFCDSLELAAGPDKKKVASEAREGGLAWACCGMRGWRQNMEDASLMLPRGYMTGEWRDASLFGVFDGHGGEQVARFTVRRLPQVLASFGGADMEASFRQAYLHLDELLRRPSSASELRDLTLPGNETQDNAENCGTTAVCCLIQGQEMILAHVGDSRAVLCQQGRAVRLTEDHKPELVRESARIEAAGGFVQEGATAMGSGKEYRVNGGLNLSRALGDLRYKSDVKLKPWEQLVSAVPDTKRLLWTVGVDEFVLLASDGVWECMEDQQAVNFVRSRLPPPGSRKGLVPVLQELLDSCCASTPTQRGGLGCDNMTVVIVRFEDPTAVVADEELAPENGGTQVSESHSRQLEAALSQTIQRLRRKESKEEMEARREREKKEREEREAEEQEELRQQELRRKRRAERALLESKSKKKLKCCIALEDEEDSADSE